MNLPNFQKLNWTREPFFDSSVIVLRKKIIRFNFLTFLKTRKLSRFWYEVRLFLNRDVLILKKRGIRKDRRHIFLCLDSEKMLEEVLKNPESFLKD